LTTIHPDLRKTMTPNRWIMQVVNTPSQVPNSTGSDTKKLVDHQGLLLALWTLTRSSWKSSAPPAPAAVVEAASPETSGWEPESGPPAVPSEPSWSPNRAQSMSRTPRVTVM
ncbi:unnamed protein product, partial [Ixodes persulcatus]